MGTGHAPADVGVTVEEHSQCRDGSRISLPKRRGKVSKGKSLSDTELEWGVGGGWGD